MRKNRKEKEKDKKNTVSFNKESCRYGQKETKRSKIQFCYAFILIDFWPPNSNFKDKKYNHYKWKDKKYSHNDKKESHYDKSE